MFVGISGTFYTLTGVLDVSSTGTITIIYVGRDVNGVVIEKGSVVLSVTS
ncbi:MAG: hypothetical protein WAM41_13615 [Psychrobacillus psychrotolerans]